MKVQIVDYNYMKIKINFKRTLFIKVIEDT